MAAGSSFLSASFLSRKTRTPLFGRQKYKTKYILLYQSLLAQYIYIKTCCYFQGFKTGKNIFLYCKNLCNIYIFPLQHLFSLYSNLFLQVLFVVLVTFVFLGVEGLRVSYKLLVYTYVKYILITDDL